MEAKTNAQLLEENIRLRERLKEVEAILHAVRHGASETLPASGPQGGEVVCSGPDVAALREANRAIGEQLQFLQTLMDTIPSPIFHKDVNGIYRGCNKTFEIFDGRRREDIIGKTARDIYPEELAEIYSRADEELLRTAGIQVYEAVIRRQDHSAREVIFYKASFKDLQGNPVGLVGVIVDIAERKKAEQERARLATAVAQVAEAIIVTDAEGKIEYVNPAFERLTGYSRVEAAGQRMQMVESGARAESLPSQMWDTLRRGEVWTGHIVNRRKDGRPLHLEAAISPVVDSSGKVINYVAVNRDVTREMELQAQLRQSQKMEALGTLAGGIAHDFNNILGIILGFTELAMFGVEPGSEIHKHLDDVRKAGHRASRLVKQILAFSRQTEQERYPVQVSLIVKESLKMLRASLPSTIEIRQDIVSSSQVLADPTHIHQVIMNLCTNAHHAMRESGGVLNVTLRDVELDAAAAKLHDGLLPGSHLQLTVKDTGHGVDPSISEKIFDPYFTTKPAGEGTGLGLSVVHGIVKSLGGDITFRSEPGKGTEFCILLPLVEPRNAAQEESDTVAPQGNRERVLFVDDEKQMVELAEKMLQRLGYQPTGCDSSPEALRMFRAEPDKFDLVITDMTMPGLTGLQLAKELQRIRPHIPIILCTGFSDIADAAKAKEAGCREFVLKPLNATDLAAVIRRALGENR